MMYSKDPFCLAIIYIFDVEFNLRMFTFRFASHDIFARNYQPPNVNVICEWLDLLSFGFSTTISIHLIVQTLFMK